MKKILTILLILCSICMVSCKWDNINVFNIALPSTNKITNASYFERLHSTITQLYIQDSDNVHYSPEMAKSMPVDVTSEYIGDEWGIEDGEIGKAWKIELRDDLCWENGEKIVAQDFIDTIVMTKDCKFDVVNGWRYNGTEYGCDISEVGVKVSDNCLVLIYPDVHTIELLCERLSNSTFVLVHKKTYNECLNDYGTSVDKYLSYGPYKLEQFNEEGVRLVRNENWFGYKNLNNEYFETDEIIVEYLDDYSTSYDLLKDGIYDYIELLYYLSANKDNLYNDIDEKYIYNSLSDMKQILMINSDYDTLLKLEENRENINYTILSIPEFRQALVYCLNWSRLKDLLQENHDSKAYTHYNYCLHPFYSNYNDVNKYTGEFFQDTKEFQEVLEEYYGEILGTVDGIEKANELFTKAYNIALQKGYLTEDDIIYIDFSAAYDTLGKGNVIVEEWKKAISETVMADKIKFYDPYSSVPEQSKSSILWLGVISYNNYNIAEILDYSKTIKFPDYSNEKLSIQFDKVIDIKGKEYNNVTLVTTINDWIDGFYDLQVKTKIVSDSVEGEEIIISYKDNALLTNKIMAECEKFVLTDYCIIPTVDTYNTLIFSENINFNYDLGRHHFKIDFRFITYK